VQNGGQVYAATATGPGWEYIIPLNGAPIQKFGPLTAVEIGVGQLSPNGDRIVADSSCVTGAPADCKSGLVEIVIASKENTQVTTQDTDYDPLWSPDGSRIAFFGLSGAERGLWVVNADGTGLTRLTTPGRRLSDHDIAWSPDGSSIVFTRSDITKARIGDVYAVSSHGGEPRLLLSDAVADW
jgi:dipeptidyl aminopeptidase/acylaminoacyl peptidase